MSPRLLYIVNDPKFFLSHRLPLAVAARKEGYRVAVATGQGESDIERIRSNGFDHRLLPLSRSSRNPLVELRLILALARLLRDLRPDIIHTVTIKPVLYGGILARTLRVPAMVAAISGMGHLFTHKRKVPLNAALSLFYRLALGHPHSRVIVQNTADQAELERMHALRPGQVRLIPGSGVDLRVFSPSPLPTGRPLVILPARMLWDKGVGEFVKAVRILQEQGVLARFVLVGPLDTENPSCVSLEKLEKWRAHGPVEWWGDRDDMPRVFAQASLVVLPTFYREGVPKTLLEAAAAGRAVVTTDVPGCRDIVEPGVTGEIVPPRDKPALAACIKRLLDDPPKLSRMGEAARRKAEAEFGVEKVVAAHLEIYRELCPLR